MEANPDPYCRAAVFCCRRCFYEAEIYSSTEWLEFTNMEVCSKCKKAYNKHFEPGLITRDDIDDIPLHPQCAQLPSRLSDCDKCIGRSQIHWTELLVSCPYCKHDDDENHFLMVFSHYVEGKNIKQFYKWSVDWAKPCHPLLEFVDQRGHLLYGLYPDFSAS